VKRDMQSKLNAREQYNIHTHPFGESDQIKINHDRLKKKLQIVGIINCTPDSFHDGGHYLAPEKAIAHGQKLITQGANWLDIGGESTRPDAAEVSIAEELARVLPVIEALSPLTSVAIDTCKPEVAQAALRAGARMINDTSGSLDPRMYELTASFNCLYCVSHIQGNPRTMQISPTYPQGVLHDIHHFFEQALQRAEMFGIKKEHILLDPGIGYGKTRQHNYQIINRLQDFLIWGSPLYLGISRKSFLKLDPQARSAPLSATLTCATVCACSGVAYLRVHDVQEHREMLTILDEISTAALEGKP